MRNGTLAVLLLLLSSCSTAGLSYQSPGPYDGGRLLGDGTTLAEIRIGSRNDDEKRFNGFFTHNAKGSLFNAVSPAGKSLLRVRDSLKAGEAPSMETSPTELDIPPERLESLYRALRPILFGVPTGVRDRYPDGRPRTLEAESGLLVHVEEYDWGGHAFRLHAEGKGWSATVTMREFATDR